MDSSSAGGCTVARPSALRYAGLRVPGHPVPGHLCSVCMVQGCGALCQLKSACHNCSMGDENNGSKLISKVGAVASLNSMQMPWRAAQKVGQLAD